MTQHVYTRVAGFKLAVIPRAPFRIRIANEPPDAIDVEYLSPNGELFARVIPDNGGYKSKIDQYTSSLFDVLEIESGPDINHWRIETSIFSCYWPSDYAVCSNNFSTDLAPFDLVGPNEEMIYIQHRNAIPDVEAMCAPNQSVIHVERNSESEWIDLAYDHQGSAWRQRHEVVTIRGHRIAVTMQAPLLYTANAVSAAQAVARSLAPFNFV